MDTKGEVKLLVMASGVREGRGDTKTWDLDQKSGTWDEKRISEPAKVESSSANFSMDQVCPYLSIPDICHFFYTDKIFEEKNLHRKNA